MDNKMSYVQKMTFSALMIALYVVVVYLTQGFSFGAYQIRISTSLYALSYLFPFLVFPLGFANLLSNALFGGLGLLDMAGGFLVGIATTGCMVFIRRKKLPIWCTALPIILVVGLGVPIWLSVCLNLPYLPLAVNLIIGQIIPGLFGIAVIKTMKRVLHMEQTERRPL